MDTISFVEATTANGRIEKIIAEPDSTSGVVTVPKVIAAGETITIPAGRVAVLPNIQIDGTLDIQGEVFIPSGENLSGTRITYTVETIEDLITVPASYTTCIVKDPNRGGTFIYDAAKASENNGGTNFSGWVRQYDGAANVKWFGAKGDGVTDDTAAILNMASVEGYVQFSSGSYLCKTVTLDFPLFFEVGANLLVPIGETITISHRIESCRQWIFQGDGDYVLGHDSDSGEDARYIHASWFGAFPHPSPSTATSVHLNIQKAFDSVGNTRESIVAFDIGNYRVDGKMLVPRCCTVQGAGIRKTVFIVNGDIDVFETNEEGCEFKDIQFETVGHIQRTSGYYIKLSHNNCVIDTVNVSNGFVDIIVNGNSCKVYDVNNMYSTAGIGSSIVQINGSNTNVRNISNLSAPSTKECCVYLGYLSTSAISNNTINSILTNNSAIPLKIYADSYNVWRIAIDGIYYNGYTGSYPVCLVNLETTGTSSIRDVKISNVNASSYLTNGIYIKQTSSGTTEDITMSNITIPAISGFGIMLERTNGTLKDVFITDSVNVKECASPIVRVGSMNNIFVSPLSIYPNVNASYSWDTTIKNNDVYIINLGRSLYSGSLIVNAAHTEYGMYSIRAAYAPAIIAMTTPSANMNTSTSVLTGTTGTDGKITVSVTDSTIYVENRSGSSRRTTITLNTGIM